jgi:hypothetical protein
MDELSSKQEAVGYIYWGVVALVFLAVWMAVKYFYPGQLNTEHEIVTLACVGFIAGFGTLGWWK